MRPRAALASALLLLACSGTSQTLKGGPRVAAFAPAGVTDQLSRPRRLALVVGVDHFEDERFSALKYSGADAAEMAKALSEFDEVQLLAGAQQTSRAAILAALAGLETRAKNPGDTVVLYFSSHGSLATRPGGELARYLVARDSRLDLMEKTGISIDDMLAMVDRIPSRRKAVILALCHSGKGKSQLADSLAASLSTRKGGPTPLELVSEALVVVTACAFGESAREHEALGHDIYTHFLLEALERGDRDGDGAVTISEAHDYARERTYQFTAGAQRPTSEADILGKDPIVLRGAVQRTGKPVLYSYAPSAEGLKVLLDGQAKGSLPGGIAVEPGRHQLELLDEQRNLTLYKGELELEAGSKVELSQVLPPPPRWSVSLEATALLPLSAAISGTYLPSCFGSSLGARLSRWPLRHGWLALRLGGCGGAGQAPGFGESLPFGFLGFWGALASGATIPIGAQLEFSPGVQLSYLSLRREFHLATFRGEEQAGGPLGAVLAEVAWSLGEHLRLHARVELGALVAPLGPSSGPHGFAAFGAGAAAVF